MEQLKSFFDNTTCIILFVVILYALIFVPIIVAYERKRAKIDRQIEALSNNSIEMTPEEFFEMRNSLPHFRQGKNYALTQNFEGVYIFYNKTKNKYYVGQSIHVLNRITAHLSGRGNGDVYADYKYGDEFTIRAIALNNSQFSTLNDLERHMIAYYKAFSQGYNKTRGNN